MNMISGSESFSENNRRFFYIKVRVTSSIKLSVKYLNFIKSGLAMKLLFPNVDS